MLFNQTAAVSRSSGLGDFIQMRQKHKRLSLCSSNNHTLWFSFKKQYSVTEMLKYQERSKQEVNRLKSCRGKQCMETLCSSPVLLCPNTFNKVFFFSSSSAAWQHFRGGAPLPHLWPVSAALLSVYVMLFQSFSRLFCCWCCCFTWCYVVWSQMNRTVFSWCSLSPSG